jgi:pimeloyl-ACP methyl ester carboxylesterase
MSVSELFPTQLAARVSGAGPTVVCLHSSGASSQQWQLFADSLTGYRVVRVDTHGHGQSHAPADASTVFELDARGLGAIVASAADGVHLVGHSYGSAVALRFALMHRRQVRSLSLYEPVLFSLLNDPAMPSAAREDLGQVGRTVRLWTGMRQPRRAARLFIDFWAGVGSWVRMGARQQQAVVQRMPVIAGQFTSLFGCGVTLAQVAELRLPTLLMSGARSRPSALQLVDRLAGAWPHAKSVRFPKLGHLGPITHAAQVNAQIARFLEDVDTPQDGDRATATAAPALLAA